MVDLGQAGRSLGAPLGPRPRLETNNRQTPRVSRPRAAKDGNLSFASAPTCAHHRYVSGGRFDGP